MNEFLSKLTFTLIKNIFGVFFYMSQILFSYNYMHALNYKCLVDRVTAANGLLGLSAFLSVEVSY